MLWGLGLAVEVLRIRSRLRILHGDWGKNRMQECLSGTHVLRLCLYQLERLPKMARQRRTIARGSTDLESPHFCNVSSGYVVKDR